MIEPELIPAVDALLTGLDPRLTNEVRNEHLTRALSLAPEFTLGALSQILMDYHSRAEKAAGRPSGFYVDAMRARMLGGLPDDDLLGYAVGAAAAGEHVEVRHVQVTPRKVHIREVDTEPRRPRPGDPDYTVAHAAQDAAEASRRRMEAELGMSGIQQGGAYPSEDRPFGARPSGPAPEGVGDPARRLLERLERQRMDEAAIDSADLDDPMQARAAIAGSRALDPEQAATSGDDNDHGAFGTQPIPCGHPTSRGPCALRTGHPELPVPGTEMGHLAE